MIYFLVQASKLDENSLRSFMNKQNSSTLRFTSHGCREIANRNANHNMTTNLIMCDSGTNGGTQFIPNEILTDTSIVTQALQKIQDNSKPNNTRKIVCGNRFFMFDTTELLRSPLGSLYTGMLKILTTETIEANSLDDFSSKFISRCVNTTILGTATVSATVALVYYLFLNYPNMPGGFNANTYGTHEYYTSRKSQIKTLLGDSNWKSMVEFISKAGALTKSMKGLLV